MVSATKSMIETHVAEKNIRIILIIIINTKTILHYTMETMSKLTVILMNYHRAGFHLPYKTILSNGMNL